MKKIAILSGACLIPFLTFSQITNTFPATGNAGIGTTTPSAGLHIKTPGSSPYIFIDKENGLESGIALLKAGVPNFYIFSDNEDSDALKIEATGLTGEGDMSPRLSLPLTNRNILLGLSGGDVGIGTSSPVSLVDLTHLTPKLTFSPAQYNGTYRTTLGTRAGAQAFLIFGNNGQNEIRAGNSNPGGYLDFFTNNTANQESESNGNLALRLAANGNVGVGTTQPDEKLTVAGNIHSREVKVTVNAGADFVFQKDYHLKPLSEVEKYISDNKHLPEIASADEMKKNGLELGEMNIKLLQKVEELTLHLIEQDKRLKKQEQLIEQLMNKK